MSDESKPLIEGVSFRPVIVEPAQLREPRSLDELDDLGYGAEAAGFSIGTGYYDDEVSVQEVDLSKLLAYLFHASPEQIPQELLALGSELGLEDAYNWVARVQGYYDDEYGVEFAGAYSVGPSLRRWYWQLPNSIDADGVLAYCRAKGLDTAGLSPLAAIKEQLRRENPGRTNSRVEKANSVRVQRLHFGEINLGFNDRVYKVGGRAPLLPEGMLEAAPKITGVVIQAPNQQGRKFELVDGFHRMHDQLKLGKRVGDFISLI